MPACGQWLDGSVRLAKEVAASHLFFLQPLWHERSDRFGEEGLGAVAVIGTEVADIDVQGDASDFRPSVYCEMGLGEDDGAGDAGRSRLGVAELMEKAADDGQPMSPAGVDAKRLKAGGIEKEGRWAAAVVEIGDEVQALHALILCQIGCLSGFHVEQIRTTH